jgi:hypothetical protein
MTLARCTVLLLLLVPKLDAQQSKVRPLPHNYVLRGTVRNAETATPVPNVRIWPGGKGWGAVTDSAGYYELQWRGRALWTFIVRQCDEHNLTTFQVDFFRDSIVRHDIALPTPTTRSCTSNERAPWAVDARDSTQFQGHYTYSWEGGGWLTACDGKTYQPDWDSELGEALKPRRIREGQVTFVRFQGRVAPDGLDQPGTFRVGYHPLYLVSRVEEVREPQPIDCR